MKGIKVKTIATVLILIVSISSFARNKAAYPDKRKPTSSAQFHNFNIESTDVEYIKKGIADAMTKEETLKIIKKSCGVDLKAKDSHDVALNASEIAILPVAQNSNNNSNTVLLYATAVSLCLGNKCQGYDTKILKALYSYEYDAKGNLKQSLQVEDCMNTGHNF